jgi:hypothetical protein
LTFKLCDLRFKIAQYDSGNGERKNKRANAEH